MTAAVLSPLALTAGGLGAAAVWAGRARHEMDRLARGLSRLAGLSDDLGALGSDAAALGRELARLGGDGAGARAGISGLGRGQDQGPAR